MNSFKKREVAQLLNFEEGPGILLLDFSGIAGHTFKIWRGPGTQVPGSRGLGSQGPGPTFIPCRMGEQWMTALKWGFVDNYYVIRKPSLFLLAQNFFLLNKQFNHNTSLLFRSKKRWQYHNQFL